MQLQLRVRRHSSGGTSDRNWRKHDRHDAVIQAGLRRGMHACGMSQLAAIRGTGQTRVRDPACGMWIEPRRSAHRFEYEGETYYFCSQHCLETFQGGAERTRGRHEIEARILGALHNHAMRTVAQPIVSLPDRRLVGVEALARFDEIAHGSPTSWFEDARSAESFRLLDYLPDIRIANIVAARPASEAAPPPSQSTRSVRRLAASAAICSCRSAFRLSFSLRPLILR